MQLSGSAKRFRICRLHFGVTSGVGAVMASKSRCTWSDSDEETFALIEICGEDRIQIMLDGARRKKSSIAQT